MFPSLTINFKSLFNNPGILAEALLFYQKTNLILDPGSFPELLYYCGYHNLVELIRNDQLSLSMNFNLLGAANVEGNQYTITAYTVQNYTISSVIQKAVEERFGRSIESSNMVKHLTRIIGLHKYSIDYLKLLRSECMEKENLISATRIVSQGKLRREDIEIHVEEIGDDLYNIESNIPNDLIRNSAVTIHTATAALYDGELFNSSILTDQVTSNYSENKINSILRKRMHDEKQIRAFHEFVLPKYYDLKGTINSSAKNFDDLMSLWRESMKFKDWLKDEAPSAELLNAYIDKLSETTWLSKAQVKTARWILFSTVGTILGTEIGGTAGVGVSLATDFFDDLILDRLLNNWKPDQFVEGDYKDFLNLRHEA